ncbi:alkaline phosphatase family protein [soil metagenome]
MNAPLPQLDSSLPHLAEVVPSVLAAMGATGFEATLEVGGDVAGACVLLIDGLGAELLDAHAADAPTLAAMPGQTLQVGFPSTTAAGLAAVGTGCRSGQHGMVGYTFRVPDSGVVNALRWRPHPSGPDLRDELIPELVQPLPTTFERAAAAGIAVSVVSGSEFAGSGLTRATLRGGRYVGVHALGDLSAGVKSVIDGRGFCYGYHGELDMIGHLHGPGSPAWRVQLRQVDRLVASIVDELPPGGLLAVVADHGMISVDDQQVVDIDAAAHLLDGVQDIGGEARARHIYTEPGATDAVLATWREALGAYAWVAGRDEAIDAGWFGGPVDDRVRPRIGEVVAAARNSAVLLRRTVEPLESALVGHHGSLTTAEQRVPLLLARGAGLSPGVVEDAVPDRATP